MKKLGWVSIGRAVWPEQGGSIFIVVGGVVGAIADFTSFLGNVASPKALFGPILIIAVTTACLCAVTLFKSNDGEVAVRCRECDFFRVSLFSLVSIALLYVAGNGRPVSERISDRIDMILAGVSDIQEDTTSIVDTVSSVSIIKNPQTDNDFFHNSYIYSIYKRDGDNAWRSIESLYRRFTPNKIDAAELYYNVGRFQMTMNELLSKMREIGNNRNDASMLVVFARNSLDMDIAFEAYAKARKIDPNIPFAYWDVSNERLTKSFGISRAETEEGINFTMKKVKGLSGFLDAAAKKPISSYFYNYGLPYTIDYERYAHLDLESAEEHLKKYHEHLRRINQMESIGIKLGE